MVVVVVVVADRVSCPQACLILQSPVKDGFQGSLSLVSLRDENSHVHNPIPIVRHKYKPHDVEAGGLVDSQVVAQSSPRR